MKVGIDVDGVLVQVSDFILKRGSMAYRKEPVHRDMYYVEDIFGVDKAAGKKFWDDNRLDYINNPIMTNGIEALAKYFHDEHIPHVIITNRGDDADDPDEKEYIRQKTSELVYKYLPETQGIIHNGLGTKLPEILANGVDVMLEDNVEHAETISSAGKYVILIDALYNINFKKPRVIHAIDLSQVPAILDVLKGVIDGRKAK